MTIPVMKPWLGTEEAEAAAAAVASGWVAQGPRVAEFEQAIADRVGAAAGVAVTSCTTALHLSLVVAGIGAGDDVIVPSLSFIATANAARYVGANPVFADVERDTQNLSRRTIEAVLTPTTRAVVVVHQTGVPAPLDEIHELCDPRGIAVIEDAACAIGAVYGGRPIGSHSDLVCLSFHPRKVITTGEGGMVLTSRADWAARMRRLREHGMSASAAERHASSRVVIEEYVELGFNYRMTDIQAAVGLVQLGRLDEIVARRRELAHRYHELLAGIAGLRTIEDPPYGTTNYQSFWVVLDRDFPVGRNELLQQLQDHGVSARRGIMASHMEPAYAGHPHGDLRNTELLTDRSLILPLFHTMTDDEQQLVVEVLRTATLTSAA